MRNKRREYNIDIELYSFYIIGNNNWFNFCYNYQNRKGGLKKMQKCSKYKKPIKYPFFYIPYGESLFLIRKSKLVCKECYWEGEPRRARDRFLNSCKSGIK